ncbi:MAG: TetM/TetW/TetO/TetS family tetracycline resistance ribosomal protection protein [Clostridia bacterium]|nr:TetM/TetW/TetO/TetS family tetracycline resistance ribosomal protection protein [Clostridia bacterium]
MAGKLTVGLAAHVDAGKTTLSEAMLFLSGAVRRQGRVDHGDAFLDTEKMEKERGITIFSKEARLTWKKTDLTLVDTPGHTDFAGEAERAISVMDAAVLVISATEGIQSHTRTLWKLLESSGVPVIFFINKMDRFTGAREELMAALSALSDRTADFTGDPSEAIALCDDTCLDLYLREGVIPENRIRSLVRGRKLFPCFFGAALKNEGVESLLDFLAGFAEEKAWPKEFGARVYKIARDPQGNRLTFLKVTGGEVKARDQLSGGAGDTAWSEKIAEIRQYSGAKYTAVPRAAAGELCCVTGLTKAMPGDGLGTENAGAEQTQRPCYACRVIPGPGEDLHRVLDCLQTLTEEEPLLQTEFIETRREIRVHSMGDVYLEVLKRQMKDRFGMEISFGETSVLYRETIAEAAEGVGHYEPLRHYAEVHLWLEPLEAGSGLVFDTDVSTDDLALNWQRLILTHLKEKIHRGVLTGAPVTDMKITLINGKAHLKHTEGGDFRQATYRAVRQGLMKARSILLEPYLLLEITAPQESLGRIMNDLSVMGGKPEGPEDAEEGFRIIRAVVPASACRNYARDLNALTRGLGRMTSSFFAYLPCAEAEKIIAEKGYDPLRDLANPPDSVFCSHGAGVVVPWDQVEQYMHLPLRDIREKQPEAGTAVRTAAAAAPRGSAEEEEALRIIFEKTYGPAKTRQLLRPAPKEEATALPEEKREAVPDGEILLVDGYNVLFAWEEWKDRVQENFDAARMQLTELMCDYAGMTGKEVILVFDAYKVRGGAGSAEKYKNIYVVYTREAQTADAYIEKTTLLARNRARVRVVTSDRPEQLIALGNEALRTSAREFRREVIGVQGSIADFIAKNNRPGTERSLERLYKEAWKKNKTE